jgi:hypothetical protein
MPASDSLLAALRKRFRFSEGSVPHATGDMVHEVGKAPQALLYSLLFVPDLSIVADSVLLTYLDDAVSERFLEAKSNSKFSLERLEASFNNVEVGFLFADRNFDENEERLLAERIAEAWRGALAVFCPDRTIVVRVVPAEENAGDIRVEFFERRSGRN